MAILNVLNKGKELVFCGAKNEIASLRRVIKMNQEYITPEHLTELQQVTDMANSLLIEALKGYAKTQVEKAVDKSKK